MARKGVGNLCISLTFLLVFMKTEFYDTRGFVYCADIRREPKLLRLFTISFRIGCEALHWRMFLNRLCCVLRNNDDVVLGREGERKRERERETSISTQQNIVAYVSSFRMFHLFRYLDIPRF
jgi:hypothetical protein